ncbi:hypothetical protein ASPVEDRAFT_134225 [Aspergillus versicolor CBS 583.65]|uniref:Uncharacterized protein n=1 Tax=Aspergillus versicolor CBS 583.65 TaxID=1036611 RepID=A0A1L9PPB9_ASPVE|nr:uncharacterized protein ASPVEDRAFT_134225 [Aspergillus versicolor CBS 583.65]OJJ03331.1 hypothetical protein ASPVEDRAFT_134225 [Aspergillus versicolor CBS 583.65]
MDSEPPLPPPPRIRHRSPTAKSQGHHQPRPRASSSQVNKTYRLSRFDDHSSQPSSDPALFSSDDIPASGLENYHAPAAGSGSRKRRYRGTWWGEMVKEKETKRKRADFKDKRLVDSGVWMGSDESVGSFLPSEDTACWGEELLIRDEATGMASARGIAGLPVHAGPAKTMRVEESRENQMARAVVNDCLERGLDSIDLSNGNLRVVPQGLLRPLQHLTKLPSVREPPISEEVFSSLQPFLRLFLAGNGLNAVSGELFELDSLRVLSLRNNKLTEIPPAIRRLTKLQELNLSVNRLNFLPWELLWLIKKGDLKHLTVRPNPLSQIEESELAQCHLSSESEEGLENLKAIEYEGPPPEEAWAPIHIATGPVRRFNMEGFPVPDTQASTVDQSQSHVPSLREVSLLSFSRSSYFDTISDEEMADFPSLMLRLLRHAREVRSAGGRSCSVCHRSFVIARTEWFEWWDCSTYENGLKGPRVSGEKLRPLPFRRLGCSLACLPERA